VNPPIVINATNLGKYVDGIGMYVLNLVRELAAIEATDGFIIYLNRSSREHLRDVPFPPRTTVRWVSPLLSPDHGFRGHALRLLFSQYLGLRHLASTIFVASQLEAIVLRRNQIIMIHDIIPLLFGRLHKKQYFYFRFILGHVLRRARWIVTPSQHTKELLQSKYGISGSRVQVIPNGVRASALMGGAKRRTGHEGKYILFTGRNVPMKNLPAMLRAFELIKDRVPHRVVITGRERGRRILPPGRSGPTDRVEFAGYVSPERMERLLSGASLLVYPSLYEGFGLPPLEGMAYGCPVVVSNVSSLPEVCGDAAHYVDPSDDQSIANGMYRVLTDRKLRIRLIARGFDRARQFPWKLAALRHVTLFDDARGAYRQESGGGEDWRSRMVQGAHACQAIAFLLSLLMKHHVR
jgi:glycosyltransferase involved in cell wall biosynthesis